MKPHVHLVTVIAAIFNVTGCSSDVQPEREGFQAIHANATGDGWRGPIRGSDATALADAEAYAKSNGIDPKEIMVLAIHPGMDTTGKLPPNPLAKRSLDHHVSLESLTGYWQIIHKDEHASDTEYYLDVQPDGQCKTDYGARFIDGPFDGFDSIEVLTDSSFVIVLTLGESYVFAVTKFDGHKMDALLDGWDSCPHTFIRKNRPSDLKLAEPSDEPESPVETELNGGL